MSIDEAFAKHLSAKGYNPRSSRYSDYLSEIIIDDLIDGCPLIRDRAARGEVVAKLRHHQQVGHDDWVIDIAIGTCAGKPVAPVAGGKIRTTEPAMIQIAIELKSILTEHGKARKNRLRDINAFHGYAHQYSPQTVAAAFLVVNSAEHFYSPLRRPNDVTRHGSRQRTSRQLAHATIAVFRAIHLRNTVTDPPGLEAIGAVVIEHDNLAFHPSPQTHRHLHRSTQVAPVPPSLPVGDPMHYQTMIQRVCAAYVQRFL